MDNMNPVGYGLNFPHFQPLNFRDYRNYLPTAYDNGLSMQESLLQVLNFCNEIGLLNQKMSDNWNTMLGWIKTNGIDDAVTGQLNAWIADGTMAKVLDKTVLNQINQKMDDLLADYPAQLQAAKDLLNNIVDTFKNDVNNTLDGQNIKIQQNYDSLMQQLSSISTGVKGVYNNLAALTAAKPSGDTGTYVTTDTGHWFFWNGTTWQDGGQFQAAQVGQDQIDLIKQQTLDFDNVIVNGAAINSALGNRPFSAIGNVRLNLLKGYGVQAINNDVTATKKGINISFDNSLEVFWFDETLKMSVRNDDISLHAFVVDYVGVKKDGTILSLSSPLTKFSVPGKGEVNVTTTVPRMSRLSTVAYNDLDHLQIMTYTEADASCQMSIGKAKLYNQHNLPDIDNEEKTDNDELISNINAFSDNLSSQDVFVESINKHCKRFYTSTGNGAWSTIRIPMRYNLQDTQPIQDDKLDRPLKGSVVFKIPTDVSAINKYSLSFRVFDKNGQSYIFDIGSANTMLKGNTLKYDFNVPSINNISPNIVFDHLELAIVGYDIANFDVTLIDASLKFNAGETTVRMRKNADLGINIMESVNEFDNTMVSASGAVSCTIDHILGKNGFKITKDSTPNSGTASIVLQNFLDYDLWDDKQLGLDVVRDAGSLNIPMNSLNIPMNLTLHLADGTSVPVPLNPLLILPAQTHHAQKIKMLQSYLQGQTDPVVKCVTLDFTVNAPTAVEFYITDISFKSYVTDGTNGLNYLPDKSAKLPQLRLFDNLSKLQTPDDKIVVPCSFVNHEQTINGYAQLAWQGNSTLAWPKKSYKIALFSDPEATVKLNFKPMPNFYSSNKFTAKADYIDRFHVRNGYGAWLFKEILQTRQNLPRFFNSMNNFGEIQIMPINIVFNTSTNLGIYTLQTKKSNDLYGMDKNKPNDIAIQGIDNTAGAMWRTDTVTFDPEGDVGDFELISDSDKQQNVQSAINRLATFINSSTDVDFKGKLDQYIDIDSLCDLAISAELTQNFDNTAGKNITYVTHDALKWYVQAYDMDATLGASWQPGSTQDDDVKTVPRTVSQGNKLLSRFVQLFPDALKARFNEIDNSGVIAPFRMQEKFKSMVDSIGEYNFEQDNATGPNEAYKGKNLSYILWLINHRYYHTKNWITNL